MIDYNQALLDPTSVFTQPKDVLASSGLSDAQKIKILRRWEYDARELQVAEEENMPGKDHDLLHAILKALLMLGVEVDYQREPPTKQGGE